MKRPLALGLALLAVLAVAVAPATAAKPKPNYFGSSITVKATYDTATEIVSVTGKVTSPQVKCEKRREVLVTVEPLDETFKSVNACGRAVKEVPIR